MRRSDLVQHKEKEKGAASRTSQIVFGERQHLLRVLDSLEGTDLPIARAQQELTELGRQLRELELNRGSVDSSRRRIASIDSVTGAVLWHAHQKFPASAASKDDVNRVVRTMLASLPTR